MEKRKQIHAILDPLWKKQKSNRKNIYNEISQAVGFKYHTAQIRSVEEADKVLEFIKSKWL